MENLVSPGRAWGRHC